jgi:hypothetical protein
LNTTRSRWSSANIALIAIPRTDTRSISQASYSASIAQVLLDSREGGACRRRVETFASDVKPRLRGSVQLNRMLDDKRTAKRSLAAMVNHTNRLGPRQSFLISIFDGSGLERNSVSHNGEVIPYQWRLFLKW